MAPPQYPIYTMSTCPDNNPNLDPLKHHAREVSGCEPIVVNMNVKFLMLCPYGPCIIPVPGQPGEHGTSVESIWNRARSTEDKTIYKYGPTGTPLTLSEAQLKIYLPAYAHHLQIYADNVNELREIADRAPLILLDWDANGLLGQGHLSYVALLQYWLTHDETFEGYGQ